MTTKKQDAPETPVAPPTQEAETRPVDAVIVVKSENPLDPPQIALNGNLQTTEVLTLLELGVKAWRGQLGL